MSGTETHANSVDVDPDFPQENVITGEDYSKPIRGQSSPHGEDVAIIMTQIDEDMRDLKIFTARVEEEDDKIAEKTRIMLELKAELEMLQKQHQETTLQLSVERDVEKLIESLSQEFASCLSSSICATGLMKIYSSNTDDAVSLIRSTMESLYRAQERYSRSISEFQSRLRINGICLRLLLDRKHSLEMICDEFRRSIKRKRSIFLSQRLPTEILIQIFNMAVAEFIQDKAINSHLCGGHPVLSITLVCQRWYNIAVATARLWRYIPVNREQEEGPPRESLSLQQLYERANQSKELFLDLSGGANKDGAGHIAHMQSWSKALATVASKLENKDGDFIPTTLSINYCGEPMSLNIPFKRIHTYSLCNLYPIFLPSEATHVTSLFLHFRSQPSLNRLVALLRELQNLTSLDVLFQGIITHTKPTKAFCPSLKRLGVRSSMIPLLFGGERSISRVLTSLNVHADTPWNSSFLHAETWHCTVESGGLATGLQYLALDGSKSLSSTGEYMVPLLLGLKSVATLALCGPFLAPILDKLSKDQTLLPSLRRLEMHGTDMDQIVVEGFLASRLEPREDTPGFAPIRELLLDRCSNITRDFCDHLRGKIEKLVVYS